MRASAASTQGLTASRASAPAAANPSAAAVSTLEHILRYIATSRQGRPASGGTAPAEAAAVPVTAVPSRPIVALGDSITYGWGVGATPVQWGPAPAHSYPWYLERDLGIPVVNAGISGTTAHEVLDPASEPGHPRPRSLQLPALLALHPRLMIVSFGSNEAQRGWPVSQTGADLERILRRVSSAGVPIVLVGTHVDCMVDPCQGPEPGYTRQRYLANWDTVLSRLAATYHAGLVLDVEHGFGRADLTDWIHPTARGYALMAQRIEVAVSTVLDQGTAVTGSPGSERGGPAPDGAPAPQGWRAPPSKRSDPPDPQPQNAMFPSGPHTWYPLLHL
jgi:acyl-CoA thioesterase-1